MASLTSTSRRGVEQDPDLITTIFTDDLWSLALRRTMSGYLKRQSAIGKESELTGRRRWSSLRAISGASC